MEYDQTHEQALTFIAVLLIFWGGSGLTDLLPRIISHVAASISWFALSLNLLDAMSITVGVTLLFRARVAQTLTALVLVIKIALSIWNTLQQLFYSLHHLHPLYYQLVQTLVSLVRCLCNCLLYLLLISVLVIPSSFHRISDFSLSIQRRIFPLELPVFLRV